MTDTNAAPVDATYSTLATSGGFKDMFYGWHGGNADLFLQINHMHSPQYDLWMRLISSVGNHHNFAYYIGGLLVFVLFSALLRAITNRGGNKYFFSLWTGVMLVLIIGYVVNGGVVEVLKNTFSFPRPYVALSEPVTVLEPQPPEKDYKTFPSGHAAFITMMVVGLWPALGVSLRWFGVLMILAVSWSRMALGVHFPADVLGGILVTLIVVPFLRKIIYSILRRAGLAV